MRKLIVTFMLAVMAVTQTFAQWASVNFDYYTTAAMTAAYATQILEEEKIDGYLSEILDHYESSEVAAAGIFATKYLDRRALQNAGRFGSADENYYYRRIRTLVESRIMPRVLRVAILSIKHPEKAMYWGPFLYKVCEDTKNLCMQFETVVCNSRISFQDIVFYSLSDQFKELFNLVELGSVDWKRLFENLTEFDGITKEDIKHDFSSLLDVGAAIASAGGGTVSDNVSFTSGKIGQAFSGKYSDIVEAYDAFMESYELFSDPDNLKQAVLDRLGVGYDGDDENAVLQLLGLGDYNITQYISDYIDNLENQYYKQRYYIYYESSGNETLAMWYPYGQPGSSSYFSGSMQNSGTYYLVYSNERYYSFNSSAYQEAMNIAQTKSGWSPAYVQSLRDANPDRTYTLDYPNWYTFTNSNPKAIGCSLKVTARWNTRKEVYEEVFDSYSMSHQAFLTKMNTMVQGYNDSRDQSSGVVYKLGYDEKQYYSESDEKKMKGCASVSYSMTCSGGAELTSGSFSWKVNQSHNHGDVRDDSRRYAMETTLPDESYDTQVYDERISELTDEIDEIMDRIAELEEENKRLSELKKDTTIEAQAEIIKMQNGIDETIKSLKRDLEPLNRDLTEVRNARSELLQDYASSEDEIHRIPSVMKEMEDAFSIRWSGPGAWSGNTFIRQGTIPGLRNADVTFTANLKCTRKESHFLGIRYHRAILQVDWKLNSSYSSKSLIETMPLDLSATEAERAEIANERLHELQEEYPSCLVEMEYAYNAPAETEQDEDVHHLLWVSDRLKIAREIDYRLTRIDARLLQAEKYLYKRESILSYLKDAVFSGLPDGSKSRFGGRAIRRWQRAAAHIATGRPPKEIEISDDDE